MSADARCGSSCSCLIAVSPVHKNNNFKGSIYMVFDYADYDLTGLMESAKYTFTEPQASVALPAARSRP